jgi:hypothetical protein
MISKKKKNQTNKTNQNKNKTKTKKKYHMKDSVEKYGIVPLISLFGAKLFSKDNSIII